MHDAWHSYPKVYALGHRALQDLLLDDVLVEEKIDGSQFSFGKFTDPESGTEYLRCRSKGAQLNVEAPDNMFKNAVATAQELFPKLHNGWTYRAEYLQKPKHNVLAYDRIPNKHLILFDINTGNEAYLDRAAKIEEADRLDLECVPDMHWGRIEDLQFFRTLLDRESCLGGQKVEGVVVKNYARFGIDKKVLMGKFVSELYKEVHAGEWRKANPTHSDILEVLVAKYKTPARWQKAIQHLRDAGQLEDSPRDIGKIIGAAAKDIEEECRDEIKEQLFKWAWPKMHRGVIHGLPEWYKERLLERQFEVTSA